MSQTLGASPNARSLSLPSVMLYRTVEQQTRRSITAATARSDFAPLTATLTRMRTIGVSQRQRATRKEKKNLLGVFDLVLHPRCWT
jgi:hypothetical protein